MDTRHTSDFDAELERRRGMQAVDVPPLHLSTTFLAAGLCLAITAIIFGSIYFGGRSTDFVRDNFNEIVAIAIFIHAVSCVIALVDIIKRFKLAPAALGIVPPTQRLMHVLWQIPCTMVVLVMVQGVMFLALGGKDPVPSGDSSSALLGVSPASALFGFVAIALVTPLWEELFFRGFLFGSVRARWGTSLAMAISAVLFAVAHGIPIVLPYMFTLGIILAALRIFHGNLWGPLALHVFINSMVSIGVLMAVR